jgi:formylglycine-generating enzyme required for sulfatase activity
MELRDAEVDVRRSARRSLLLAALIGCVPRTEEVVSSALVRVEPAELAASALTREQAPVRDSATTQTTRDLGTLPDGRKIEPCGAPPEGMACVQGGPFVRGAEDGPKNARPAEKVWLQTFYMDVHEVTHAAYDRCEREGRCPAASPFYEDFDRPDQPMTGVSWYGAVDFCRERGGHLPTEAEWEKAARGPDGALYPWGDEPATCERAIIRDDSGRSCGTRQRGRFPAKGRTFEVGSRPAGVYGLHDMVGNAWEWVFDWYSSSWAACGDACQGIDPRGPCDGGEPCPYHKWRVVRGGSWYWDASYATGIRRRPHVATNKPFHHFGFRCAASIEEAKRIAAGTSSSPPARALTQPMHATFWSSPEDAPTRELMGVSPERSGRHYLASNERKLHLFHRRMADLGGGYVGVGSDQAYLFIGWMRPELAWLIDYDPQVVHLHLAYQALIAAHHTPASLMAAFSPTARDASLATIARTVEPARRKQAQIAYRRARRSVWKRLQQVRRTLDAKRIPSWLTDQATYDFVRESVLAGRVRPMVANLLAEKALAGIAVTSERLGVPIRAVYLSNAEEYWQRYSDRYRENMASLPFDESSVVLRTVATYEQNLDYHYNVQGAASYLAWLRDPKTRDVYQIVRHPRGKRRPRPPEYSEIDDLPRPRPISRVDAGRKTRPRDIARLEPVMKPTSSSPLDG